MSRPFHLGVLAALEGRLHATNELRAVLGDKVDNSRKKFTIAPRRV